MTCNPLNHARRLLFLTPVEPKFGGKGIAMRAALHVYALSQSFDVHVLVVRRGETDALERPADIAALCKSLHTFGAQGRYWRWRRAVEKLRPANLQFAVRMLLPPPEAAPFDRDEREGMARLAGPGPFDVIFAFHMGMAPAALALKEHYSRGSQRPKLVLDLDDIESKYALREAEVRRKALGRLGYRAAFLHAARLRRAEARFARLFDQIYVCSDADAAELNARVGSAKAVAVPNGIHAAPAAAPAERGQVATILFVGTMSYGPNEDAALFFCEQVVPLIRQRHPEAFRVLIVGRAPPARVQRLASLPEVTVTGAVPDVGAYYLASDIAIAPIRFGGGTRIKILEAFSFGCPVVSTTIGAEGLKVTAGKDILIADDPEAFARRCVDLMRNAESRRQIAGAARELLSANYSRDAVARLLNNHLRRLFPSPQIQTA